MYVQTFSNLTKYVTVKKTSKLNSELFCSWSCRLSSTVCLCHFWWIFYV